ncbi:hypothetical protein L6452_15778 [Arctium lappa]|uniref:Uncharacterized protein n=1 Tax=Arctium lappa TaxID=4217 RepID=A0ACB9CPQ9_ARCLA|nr:hypothetical protein L6452_15778 [Arctium lappa]
MISSTSNIITYICFLCTFSLCFYSRCCSAKDYITTGESIHDGAADYLESAGKKFQMGFFPHTQRGSERRYVGIWYAMDPTTVVWVANRNQPVPDSTGFLTVTEDGEVKVLDKNQKSYYSKNAGGVSNKTLKLLDSGNAVLVDIASETIKWQSFLEPTDTFLPGMKMDSNLKLTSWKSLDDPSTGSFEFRVEEMQYVIMNGTIHRWKSGSGSKKNFEPNQIFSEAYNLLSNSSTRATNKTHCKPECSLDPASKSYNYPRLSMSYTGNIQYFSWAERDRQWVLHWDEPKDICSVYQVCGQYGLCNSSDQTKCRCLPGFVPNVLGDDSAGCSHKPEICLPDDKFTIVPMIKVANPTSPFFESNNHSDCQKHCLESCSCKAYSYIPGNQMLADGRPGRTNSCWIWDSDLYNLQTGGTHNISIRVSGGNAEGSPSPPENSSSVLTNTRILVFAMMMLVILLLCSLGYMYYKRLVPHEQGRNSMLETNNNERRTIDLLDLVRSRDDDIEGITVPFFEFEGILAATDNFSDANKLGEGGFGPVYKGKLPEGKEVAVKRLSSLSGQGLEEFRNEVILIAKLQHRNLVRLLGYCMKGNEKMLIYEYMPNKSLDVFIFDQAPSIWLNWAKRYEIIIGIARGLLYLHQDSRLRIIHRDLKTSNILLDEELNPKISDFGLAKIVKDKEMEASTNRVIGTYGYMAPEYALDGLFSIKSDVFSFGVVVLEIISGKKNTGFSQSQQTINLLGYTWSLWKEDRPFELMDQKLVESSNSSEVLKCIIVGLLCVQEDPGDRPTMTNVVLMLAGDIASLPTPKQPAFVARRTMSSSSSSSYKPDQTQTNNSLTITLQEGR